MKKTDFCFKKDFTLVVIGQIISLFGNAILRFCAAAVFAERKPDRRLCLARSRRVHLYQ